MKSAADPDRPCYWEKLVLAAYWRLLGGSQKAAGAAVGRSERTIRVWESDTAAWAQASEEARKRWLGEVTALARRQLLKALMNADGDLALKILERLDLDLAPATQRLKHEGVVSLTSHPEWQELRTMILLALEAFPEARVTLAEVLGDEHRNGAHA